MLIKNAEVSLKAGPDDGLADGQFTAYASVFGNVDSYGDVVVKGAFAETVKMWEDSPNQLPVLFGHNLSDPDYNIGAVVDAKEDDRGLLVTAQLDLESPKAAQVYRLIKGRRVSQMSFAYDVEDSTQREKDGSSVTELHRLKLYEISVVPIGANQETEILAVKAAATVLTDGLKAGRVLSAKNETELRSAYDSIGAVLSALDAPPAAQDQAKASGEGPTKDEEPETAKSDESSPTPSAKNLATLQVLSLI